MLKYLKIRNLAVIDEAEIEVGSGYVCLTGESGAGKSVLIDALLLLGGERASSDLVRSGCDKAVVEAEFELERVDPDLDLLEDKQLFLRREVSKDGKSRAMVNGILVPNSQLQRYGRCAFEIHGQHGQQRLLKAGQHLAIFDEQTGLKLNVSAFEEKVSSFRASYKAWRDLREGEANRLKEMDFVRLQIQEIEEVNPTEADLDLEQRLKRLRNRELIRDCQLELNEILDERAIPDLTRVGSLLVNLCEFQDELTPYIEQVGSLSATLSDLQAELDFSEEDTSRELHQLEERESGLNRLFMKYGRDVEEVLEELDRLKARLDTLSHASEGLDDIWDSVCREYAQLQEEKQALYAAREKAKGPFVKSVKRGLQDLELRKAAFEVSNLWPEWDTQLTGDAVPRLPGPELSFLFSPNPGEEPRPLARIASGGELSRVLLALINAFKRPSGRMLVFDEIDAGLGGETAHAVGAKLANLGERHQVLCVTHFAQVARFADQQIKIEKTIIKGRTYTTLAICDYEGRVAELARLMGGDTQAENLRDHARELLEMTGRQNG